MNKIISEVALCSSGLRISNNRTARITMLKIIIAILRLKLFKAGKNKISQPELNLVGLFYCF